MTESVFTTIKNLAQSCLDDFEDMDIEEQLAFCHMILKDIQNICDKELNDIELEEEDEDEEDVKYVDEWQILYKDFNKNEDEYFEEDEAGAYERFEEVKGEGQVKQFIKKTYKVTDGHIEEDWVDVIYSDYGD